MRSQVVVAPPLEGRPLLRSPDAHVPKRGALVALHGSALPDARQPIFDHLADVVTPLGYSVLSFERRPPNAGVGTPLKVQAEDAMSGVSFLQQSLDLPIGVFGFSQGAWAAAIAAAIHPGIAFLVLVGCSGVSPARQMNYYTDELLRRAGYDATQRAQAQVVRAGIDALARGEGDRHRAAAALRSAMDQPWFDLAQLEHKLPPLARRWPDMDLDPAPIYRQITCPTLLIYGRDDECVPAEASKRVWRDAWSSARQHLTIVDLPGVGHFPARGHDATSRDVPLGAFDDGYTAAIRDWLSTRLPNQLSH